MPELYVPRTRIAVASSFEGIVNDGAPECALTSHNAYHNMDPEAFFGRKLTAAEFNRDYSIRRSLSVRAFLALRPMVAVAEDYHTVLGLIRTYPNEAQALLENPHDPVRYKFFADRFDETKARTVAERTTFGKDPKTSHFYVERKALQAADYDEWQAANGPYADTLPQFRALVGTQRWESDQPVSGFFPWFATSKDEDSTHGLCVFYTKVQKLDPSDVQGDKCLIPKNRIVGITRVPSKKKADQLALIAREFDVPRAQVWRLNDRYDRAEQGELYRAGFPIQFFLPGYATPFEIEEARKDPMVRVLERDRFAEQLASVAEEWNF